MAKKKVTQKDKPAQNPEQTRQTTTMDDASEKIEHLKSLNSMLLKETVEHRQQMDSLLQSKGSLESELTRSETEKEALQAELTRFHDRTVQMELERNLVSVFVSVQVNQQSEVIEKERREKAETEKRLQSMESVMREVLREKSEKEFDSKRKLDQLLAEVENERNVSRQLGQERDSLRTEVEDQIGEINGLDSILDSVRYEKEILEKKLSEHVDEVRRERAVMSHELRLQTEATADFELKLNESEKRGMMIQEEVHKLRTEYANMMEEKEESERKVQMIMADKDAFERCLTDSKRIIGKLKGDIEEIVREKEGIEEERKVEVEKKIEEVSALKERVISRQKEEERLRLSFAEMEKRCIEGLEKQNRMVMEINVLEEAKKEMERSFERLNGEKGVVRKELDEILKQLDDQTQKVDEIRREKMEIEEVKALKESEIVEMQKEIGELEDAISALEESSNDQLEKIGQFQSEVSQYREALNLVTIERDEARKGFDEENRNCISLRDKILEMEKKIEETHRVAREMKTENCSVIGEKKELESRCTRLMKEMASLESTLSKTGKEFDDMQAKVKLGNTNSELVLNMLKKTASQVCPSKDEMGVVEDSVLIDEQKVGEEMKQYVAELDVIQSSFKKRESKAEEMKRQLEFLLAEAHKKKSFWTLMSSATTVFAAASVAYVACGR